VAEAERERERLLRGGPPLVLELFAIDLTSSYPFGTVNGLLLGRLVICQYQYKPQPKSNNQPSLGVTLIWQGSRTMIL
jgi:hypothetical protein